MTDRNTSSSRARLAALAAVVVLVVAVYAIGQAVVHHNALQNCLDSGRRDCAARSEP